MMDVMTGSMVEEWRANPLGVIRSRFGAELDNSAVASSETLDVLFRGVPAHVSVPELTMDAAPGSLVRFICFVQDVMEQELYFFRYGEAGDKTAICVDMMDDPELEKQQVSSSHLSERLPLYCITLPGQSHWALPTRVATIQDEKAFAEKRKRTLEEVDNEVEMDVEDAEVSKQKRAIGAEHRQAPPSNNMGLNLPLHADVTKGAFGVVVKLYQREAMEQSLLNQTIEVVGIVERGGNVSNSFHDADESTIGIGMSVLRLHALSVKTLQPLQFNPSTRELVSESDVDMAKKELKAALPTLRPLLVSYLQENLGGDELSAEYLLTSLISRVTKRTDSFVLGKASLNLVLPETVDASMIIDAIESIAPRVARIDLTIDRLNSECLQPLKNYDQNRLCASPLQLPTGTVLLIDESKLQPGQLNEKGLKNIKALKEVASRQIVPYDFKFYDIDMPVDLPVIVLSRSKSLIECDIVLHCKDHKTSNGGSILSDDIFGKLRLMLALLSDTSWDFDIPQEVTSLIETTFVEQRRQSPATTHQTTLSNWLSIARLQAKTYGEQTLTASRWHTTFNMEHLRSSRT